MVMLFPYRRERRLPRTMRRAWIVHAHRAIFSARAVSYCGMQEVFSLENRLERTVTSMLTVILYETLAVSSRVNVRCRFETKMEVLCGASWLYSACYDSCFWFSASA